MTEPQQRAADRAALLVAATKFFRLGVQIAILGVGAYLVLQQELTSGASIAGSIIMGRALAPVEQMIGGWKQLVQARQSFRRLQSFLGLPRLRPPGLPLPEPTGQLSVERVSYAFPGQGVALIKGINFALAPGESLAIIGPSAAGKTTLIRLLIGTLPASAGHGAAGRRRCLPVAARGFRPPCRLPAAGCRAVRRHGVPQHRPHGRGRAGGGLRGRPAGRLP